MPGSTTLMRIKLSASQKVIVLVPMPIGYAGTNNVRLMTVSISTNKTKSKVYSRNIDLSGSNLSSFDKISHPTI